MIGTGTGTTSNPGCAAMLVIPAQTGIEMLSINLDPGLRRDDGMGDFPTGSEPAIKKKKPAYPAGFFHAMLITASSRLNRRSSHRNANGSTEASNTSSQYPTDQRR